MRPVNIVDGVTVFTDENQERIDELLDQLTESVKLTCQHKDRVMHNRASTPDTNESYRSYHCEACGKSWTEWDDEAAA